MIHEKDLKVKILCQTPLTDDPSLPGPGCRTTLLFLEELVMKMVEIRIDVQILYVRIASLSCAFSNKPKLYLSVLIPSPPPTHTPPPPQTASDLQ
jgi:hypothetical protein